MYQERKFHPLVRLAAITLLTAGCWFALGWALLIAADRQIIAEIESELAYCEANPTFHICTPENIARAKELLR